MGTRGKRWTPEQFEKFRATMRAKRAGTANANGTMSLADSIRENLNRIDKNLSALQAERNAIVASLQQVLDELRIAPLAP